MSVSEVQNSLLKYKKALAILVCVSVLLCAVFVGVKQSYTARIYIQFLGEKATQGMAEDGSALDPYEISNMLVVKQALDQIGADHVRPEKVRRDITITPVMSLAEEEKYASWVENFSSYDKDEDKKPFPTHYQITFRTQEGAGFARDFLNALVAQYGSYYAQNYAHVSDVTILSGEAAMRYDHYETVELLEEKINSTVSALRSIASGDLDYRCAQTGWSVQDLIGAYENLEQTRLADVAQYVVEQGVSKDGQLLVAALQTKADHAELESARCSEKAGTQLALMQTYSQRNQDYLWEDGADEDSSQVREDIERDESYEEYKTTYDQLVLDYVAYETAARDLLIDKGLYEQDAVAFSKVGEDSEWVAQALQDVCDRYNRLYELTQLTLEDYNDYKAARYIVCVSGVSADETMGEAIYYAASVILSLGVGMIAVVFIQLKKKKLI